MPAIRASSSMASLASMRPSVPIGRMRWSRAIRTSPSCRSSNISKASTIKALPSLQLRAERIVMFRLLYTLVLLVRAGRAWRNSPNFSIVALLKVAGVTISGITVLIGAIILLMQMDIGNGPLVIGLVLGIVVVTTAFLIASIMWLTNGMGPKPASGTKPVRMNRAKLDRWTHGAAGALAVSIAAIWVVPDWLQAMPIGIAAVLG